MYRNFIQGYREAIPSGLPARLADPDLIAAGKPTFLRIGEGNEPRNELLRIVKQYPSKDEVRTKVLGEIFPPTDKDPYFNRPDNIAALRFASEELGIPIERTGLRIATHPFRLEGNVADVNLLANITNRAASNLQQQGSPVLANALTRKAKFFNQPRSYRELAVDGSEGIDSIYGAYKKAEPDVNGSSQGLRPILNQAGGLDANIGIPTGSPENIPPMDIEGMKGANRYVDVSQGLQTARLIEYPNIYDRLNNGAQPVVKPVIPYAADIPTGQEFILSPKVSIETKRPRFIDEGTGIYTRSGNPISQEQKNLLDMGMADLEDRSFILRDPASVNPSKQYRPTTRLGLQTLGLNADIGSETILPAVDFSGMTLFPEERVVNRTIQPINRLTDDLSDRVLKGEVDLRNYEPFKSNRNTYGAREAKTPWREYYSDPFVYEDKGQDNEVNRLIKTVNEAPAQLENAYIQQANANRRAIEASDKLKFLGQHPSVRMGLLPQGEGVVNLAREVRKDRRMAEIEASKATDRIAELKAAQELLGVEYMAKPKAFSSEVLQGYQLGSQNKGAIKNGAYEERIPTDSPLVLWRDAINQRREAILEDRFSQQYVEPDRDYDIASAFGFAGNY